jgi:hypothetical protein
MAWRGEYQPLYVIVGEMFLVRMAESLFLVKKVGLCFLMVEG